MMVGPEAQSLDITDALRRRRMHREFLDRPVPREVLDRMVWVALRAQQARSGVRNLVVVDDPKVMATARLVLPGFLNNAPAMIVHCTDVSRAVEVGGRRHADLASRLDAGAVCANLALYAPALELGVCTVTSWCEPALSALLGLPDHVRPDVAVAIGYPMPSPVAAPKGFRAGVHHNRFGTTWEVAPEGILMSEHTVPAWGRDALFDLAAYLTASAPLCSEETPVLATLRLVEGAHRALGILAGDDAHDDPFVRRVRDDYLAHNRLVISDEDAFRAWLDEHVRRFTEETLARRRQDTEAATDGQG